MVKLQRLNQNYEIIRQLIEENIESDRKDALLAMTASLSDRIIMSPFTPSSEGILSIPGGYSIYVKLLVDASILIAKTYKQLGGMIDFTQESLVLTAITAHIGRITDGGDALIELSDTTRTSSSETYVQRSPISNYPSNSLFTLQMYNVSILVDEWSAIMCINDMHAPNNLSHIIQISDKMVRLTLQNHIDNDTLSKWLHLN